MRLKQDYTKNGFFWLAENKLKKYYGKLKIIDGGIIELELVGDTTDILFHFENENGLNRIVGHIESDGFVTLEKCFVCKTRIDNSGIHTVWIKAQMALSGVAFEVSESLKVRGIEFAVDGLNEWIGVDGFNRNRSVNDEVSVKYTKPTPINYTLSNDMALSVEFGVSSYGVTYIEQHIIQTSYFKLNSHELRELGEFIELAHKIVGFLCFAMDKTVAISNVKADCIVSSTGELCQFDVYYKSIVVSENDLKKRQLAKEFLFHYKDVHHSLADKISAWIHFYDVLKPACDLYFSTQLGAYKYVDSMFLALAQALETYHRRISNETLMEKEKFSLLVRELVELCPDDEKDWLRSRVTYGNEISLRTRMLRMIEPYQNLLGDDESIKKLTSKIVHTRNYLTHYSENSKKQAAEKSDLAWLYRKMVVIFQLNLLSTLGFGMDEINQIMDKHEIEQIIAYQF